MSTILIVEDEAAIADTVVYALQTDGFDVQWLKLGQEAVERVQTDPAIALVVLDIGLPDGSGFDVCKTIRRFSEVPIIFLTARNEEVDRIVGLEIGADDYLCKPFSPRELSARIKAILKRSSRPERLANHAGGFVVDEARAQIHYSGQPLELTRYEYLILKYLLQQPQRVFSREQIMQAVWPDPQTSLDRAVDTHIKSLRGKLRQVREDCQPIRTHRGLGYSIDGLSDEP